MSEYWTTIYRTNVRYSDDSIIQIPTVFAKNESNWLESVLERRTWSWPKYNVNDIKLKVEGFAVIPFIEESTHIMLMFVIYWYDKI